MGAGVASNLTPRKAHPQPRPAAEVQPRWIKPKMGRHPAEPFVTIKRGKQHRLFLNVAAIRLLLGDPPPDRARVDVGVLGRWIVIQVTPQGAWKFRVSKGSSVSVGGPRLLSELRDAGFPPGRYPARLDMPGRLVAERPPTDSERKAARINDLKHTLGDD